MFEQLRGRGADLGERDEASPSLTGDLRAGVSEWAECGDWACGASALIWGTLRDSLWETDQSRAAVVRQGVSPLHLPLCHPPFLQNPWASSNTI